MSAVLDTPTVRGPTIQTANGWYFNYQQPDAGMVDIETVAHALSNICRFTGHCREFYSVAQHCVLMSYAVPESCALWGLGHEAGEPMVGDMNKPLKMLLPDYSAIENPVERRILIDVFGLDPDAKPDCIKYWDNVMLATEQRDLMPKERAIAWDEWGFANAWEPLPPQTWADLAGIKPLERKIRPWVPAQAKAAFLQRYRDLAFSSATVQQGTLVASLSRVVGAR